MSNNNATVKPNGAALIPLLVLVLLYLGVGIALSIQGVPMAFYQFPILVCALIATVLAFIMFKGSVDEKMSSFLKGMGDENVLIMCMVYLLAGAFAGVCAAMGGRDSTVFAALDIVPAALITPGMFVIAAFMGTALGTSMGTISALVPIGVALADRGALSIPIMVAAIVGGAMFGDNLSVISDTTIAATRTQGVEMRDKFRMNGLIALPAAVVTLILLFLFARADNAAPPKIEPYNVAHIIPYVVVLILSIAGMNVFLVLVAGIFLGAVIGGFTGTMTLMTFAESVKQGFLDMAEIMILALFMGGLAHMVTENGGIHWLLGKFQGFIKGKNSAQASIAGLVAVVDAATANNTVAIIITGPIARDICYEYEVDPRKSASLLDVFSCVMQGIIPYGAQLLSASSLAMAYFAETGSTMSLSPVEIIPYLWYCFLLGVFGVIAIFFPFADGLTKKRPWDFAQQRALERK